MKLEDLCTFQYLGEPTNIEGVGVRMGSLFMYEFINLPDFYMWSEESRGAGRVGKSRGEHLKKFTPTQVMAAIVMYPDGTTRRK